MCCGLLRGIAKILMFIINFAVFLCGGALIIVGSILLAHDEYKWLEEIVGTDEFNDAAIQAIGILLVSSGSLLFLTGFLGCCGSCKENSCLLTMYIIIVSILLVVMTVAGILAIINKDQIQEDVRGIMVDSVQYDYGRTDVTVSWDKLQANLDCCGAVNYTDYNDSNWQNSTGYPYPKSCCDDAEDDGSLDDVKYEKCLHTNQGAIKEGCYEKMQDWVEDAAIIIIGVVFALVGVMIIGLAVACGIKSKISSGEYA